MIVQKSFTKRIAATEAEVFRVIGSVDKLFVMLENQDTLNSLVYKFQTSDDGSSWTDLALPLENGSTGTQFSIVKGNHHEIRIVNTKPRLRLLAYGDLIAGIGLSYYVKSPTDDASFDIFPT